MILMQHLSFPEQPTWCYPVFSHDSLLIATFCLSTYTSEGLVQHLLHYRQHHPSNLPLTSALLISPTARVYHLWSTADYEGSGIVYDSRFSFSYSSFMKNGLLFGCLTTQPVWCRHVGAISKYCTVDLNSKELQSRTSNNTKHWNMKKQGQKRVYNNNK